MATDRRGSPAWRRMRVLRRILVILLSLGLSMAVYFWLFGTPLAEAVARWNAASAAGLLNILGTSVSISGSVVGTSRFAYNVVVECTALGPLLLFSGAVLAYPTTLWSKALGIALGMFLLSGLNLARLVSLFYVGTYLPRYLPVAHYLLWQAAIIVFAILLWLFWVDKMAHRAYD